MPDALLLALIAYETGVTSRERDGARGRGLFIMTRKSTRNTGKHWSPSEVGTLRDLAARNTPTRVIGVKLGRTADAIQSKASTESISLKPTNQSPYGTKK